MQRGKKPNLTLTRNTRISTGKLELACDMVRKFGTLSNVDNIQQASANNNIREVYQKKNILIDKSSRRVTQIRDSKGNIIKDEATRLQRGAEYLEDILNADQPEELLDFSQLNSFGELEINMEPPTMAKLNKAVRLLKRNKSPGIDNIPPELLKDGGDNIREWLLQICRLIWLKERTPSEWGKGIFLPLPQTGDLSYCNNNRGITLLDIAVKVFF